MGALDLIATTQEVLSQEQAEVHSLRYVGALDLIATTQEVLSQELAGVHSLR